MPKRPNFNKSPCLGSIDIVLICRGRSCHCRRVASGGRAQSLSAERAIAAVSWRKVYRHGLRASESVGMRWSQVGLDQGVIHIARVKGSNDSTHSLDRDELRDLRKLRQQVTGVYVFETERGGPLSVDALQYIVREAGRAARLDVEAHPHMLRHAAGYTLANEGVDTRLIQDFLGHADIRHTAHYTALSPRRLAAVRVR